MRIKDINMQGIISKQAVARTLITPHAYMIFQVKILEPCRISR